MSTLSNGDTTKRPLYVGDVPSSFVFKIGITIDGGGSPFTTGVKGYASSPIAGTITRARVMADQSGSVVIDVW